MDQLSATQASRPSVIGWPFQVAKPIKPDTAQVMLRSLARHIAPLIDEHGRGIALGWISYSAAFDRLWGECWWRGAGFLDDRSEAEFRDWIHKGLLRSIDYAEDLSRRVAEVLGNGR
jgi:hypothetical protein